MPRGVTDSFVSILLEERKRARRRILLFLALILPAEFLSELSDEPLFGPVVLLFWVALGGAFLGGLVFEHLRMERISQSLRKDWTRWMGYSTSSSSLGEIHRRVEGKTPHPTSLEAIGGSILAILNASLFAALWYAHPWAGPLSWVTTLANAGTLGFGIGRSALSLRFTRDLDSALRELVQSGKIGIWGEGRPRLLRTL